MSKYTLTHTIALDFDSVLNNFKPPFTLTPHDLPVDGALDFVNWLLSEGWKVIVYSSRSANDVKGTALIHDWLSRNGFPVDKMKIAYGKPSADLYLDDRAFRFEGNFDEVMAFMSDEDNLVPWNRE